MRTNDTGGRGYVSRLQTNDTGGRGVASSLLVLVLVAMACAPQHRSPVATPGNAQATGAASSPLAAHTNPPRYTVGHFVYDIESVGAVSTPGDSASRVDTVDTRSTLSYDAQWSGPQLTVSGIVRYRVTATGGVHAAASPRSSAVAGAAPTTRSATAAADSTAAPQAVAGDAVPFRATVDTVTGAVHVPGDDAAVPACPVGGPVVEQARWLATERPRSLTPGAAWQDTLTRVSCLGGIPLTTRTVRSFAVAEAPAIDPVTGAPAVHVSFTSAPQMDGEARRNMDLITLHGAGDGTTDQFYDRTTGVLLSVHTVTSLDLTYAINGRTQRLHQRADWRARRAP